MLTLQFYDAFVIFESHLSYSSLVWCLNFATIKRIVIQQQKKFIE